MGVSAYQSGQARGDVTKGQEEAKGQSVQFQKDLQARIVKQLEALEAAKAAMGQQGAGMPNVMPDPAAPLPPMF
jgi:ATP-dependent Clp protease ATP-binding subunit ClpA